MNLVQLIIGLALIIFGLFFFFMIYANMNLKGWYFKLAHDYVGASLFGFFGIIIGFIVIFWK
jgi:hypothetical protein